jgi:hypothetical protein
MNYDSRNSIYSTSRIYRFTVGLDGENQKERIDRMEANAMDLMKQI